MSLQEIRARRTAVEAVRTVVSAMRAMAAGRIQAAQRAMTTARQYREVVLRGLAAAGPGAALPLPADPNRRVLLIIWTSEQSLCGNFNHSVIDRAVAEHHSLTEQGNVEILAVGRRGSRVISARGLHPDHVEPGATSLSGLRDLVRRVAGRADHGYASAAFSAVDVVFAKYKSVSEQTPTVARILPFDPAALPTLPSRSTFHHYLPPPQLVAGLVGQYAYISLYHAAAESYASEQASRLVAMDGATRNTGRMADELTALERSERQHDITRQVLELTASHPKVNEE